MLTFDSTTINLYIEIKSMATIQITDQTFEEEVLKSSVPVLVDFLAPWCGPCHIIAPILEELSEQYTGKIKIAKLNVDENSVAEKYHVMSIPNLKIFKGGQVVDEIVGAVPKANLEEKIQSNL